MIRLAALSDLAPLTALEQASFVCDGVGRRAMAGFLRSGAALVLLDEVGGQLQGHLIVRFNARHRIARIYSIAVAAHAMGQGVGRALVARAEALARARGSACMRLEISVDNAPSQALFRACGYAVFGHYDDYYEDGGAALRLQKSLAQAGPAQGALAR
ncbi:GNAT family N-acetyltransferase [Massilia sp. DWR3-1-1]|uniref:GNAT family N-acetyltransferase n=1 Tax=Massilia sp. DWR3-1-1 TaxID=2804559 RepID=UPI003CF5FA07